MNTIKFYDHDNNLHKLQFPRAETKAALEVLWHARIRNAFLHTEQGEQLSLHFPMRPDTVQTGYICSCRKRFFGVPVHFHEGHIVALSSYTTFKFQ